MSSSDPRETGLGHHLDGMPIEWVRRILESDNRTDSLESSITSLEGATRIFHKPTVTPSDALPQPGQGPQPIVFGTVMGLEYDNANDRAFRILKIDDNFVNDNATFHVHWTKSGDIDESGNGVRWRLSYTVFDGASDEVALVTPTVIEWADTYIDSGTTSRIIYRTPDIAATGFVAGYYLGLVLEYVDSETTLTSNPVVVSADLLWEGTVNQGT